MTVMLAPVNTRLLATNCTAVLLVADTADRTRLYTAPPAHSVLGKPWWLHVGAAAAASVPAQLR
jgi:hypothetical protein